MKAFLVLLRKRGMNLSLTSVHDTSSLKMWVSSLWPTRWRQPLVLVCSGEWDMWTCYRHSFPALGNFTLSLRKSREKNTELLCSEESAIAGHPGVQRLLRKQKVPTENLCIDNLLYSQIYNKKYPKNINGEFFESADLFCLPTLLMLNTFTICDIHKKKPSFSC